MAEEQNKKDVQDSPESDVNEVNSENEQNTTSSTSSVSEEEDFTSPVIDDGTGGTTGDVDTMIEYLDGPEAREYVIAWMQEQRRLERLIAEKNIEIEKWTKRVDLAKKKGMNDLAAEAEVQLTELVNKKAKYETDLDNIKVKTDILKDKLMRMPKKIQSVDPDYLLMNIEHLLGKTIEEMTTETIFDKLDSQRTLEELKNKIKQNKDQQDSSGQ